MHLYTRKNPLENVNFVIFLFYNFSLFQILGGKSQSTKIFTKDHGTKKAEVLGWAASSLPQALRKAISMYVNDWGRALGTWTCQDPLALCSFVRASFRTYFIIFSLLISPNPSHLSQPTIQSLQLFGPCITHSVNEAVGNTTSTRDLQLKREIFRVSSQDQETMGGGGDDTGRTPMV